MNRSEILETAEQYVTEDRNDQYGEPEDNFSLIAEYWSVYLGDTHAVLDAFDVAMLMSLLKVARLSKRPENPDSAIDLAGYAACAGEILEDARRVPEGLKDLAASLRSDPSVPPAPPGEFRAADNPAAKYKPADPKILKDARDVF